MAFISAGPSKSPAQLGIGEICMSDDTMQQGKNQKQLRKSNDELFSPRCDVRVFRRPPSTKQCPLRHPIFMLMSAVFLLTPRQSPIANQAFLLLPNGRSSSSLANYSSINTSGDTQRTTAGFRWIVLIIYLLRSRENAYTTCPLLDIKVGSMSDCLHIDYSSCWIMWAK